MRKIAFLTLVMILGMSSVGKTDTPNVFDENRMSSESIFAGWLGCKDKATSSNNETISFHYCACYIDWVRTIFIKSGEKGLLNILKSKKNIQPIVNECYQYAKVQPKDSFGRGSPQSNYESSALATSSIITGQMGCKNNISNKPLIYQIKVCGCMTDYSRTLYKKYGREKFYKSLVSESGNIFKSLMNKGSYCDKYAKE